MSSLYPVSVLAIRLLPDQEYEPVLTRNGNLLLDCHFQEWPDLEDLHFQCKKITGIVEISLFYQLVNVAIIAGKDGISRYERKNGQTHLL
jgi:ribose 5-phosphate isomerase A